MTIILSVLNRFKFWVFFRRSVATPVIVGHAHTCLKYHSACVIDGDQAILDRCVRDLLLLVIRSRAHLFKIHVGLTLSPTMVRAHQSTR